MTKFNFSAAEQTINENNQHFASIIKNRRVLGLRSKSISFRTEIKREIMHKYDLKFGKTTRIAILTRAFLLGFFQKELNSRYNQIYESEMKKAKELKMELSEIANSLPELISFRLYEYEKQLFYIKCLHYGMIPVVVLRALYELDYDTLDFSKLDEEDLEQLDSGINLLDFLQYSIKFL